MKKSKNKKLKEAENTIDYIINNLNGIHDELMSGKLMNVLKREELLEELNELQLERDLLFEKMAKGTKLFKIFSKIVSSSFWVLVPILLITAFNPIVIILLVIFYLLDKKLADDTNIYNEKIDILNEKAVTINPRIKNYLSLLVSRDIKASLVELDKSKDSSVEKALNEVELANNILGILVETNVVISVKIPDKIRNIMIAMLQADLETDEEDLDKLVALAKEKLLNEEILRERS